MLPEVIFILYGIQTVVLVLFLVLFWWFLYDLKRLSAHKECCGVAESEKPEHDYDWYCGACGTGYVGGPQSCKVTANNDRIESYYCRQCGVTTALVTKLSALSKPQRNS